MLLSYLVFAFALLTVLPHALAVKRHDFKTCSQSGFCTRQRTYLQFLKESSDQILSRDLASVDWNTVEIDAKLGRIRWQVTMIYPDNSTASFDSYLQFYSDSSIQVYIGGKDRFNGAPDMFLLKDPAPLKRDLQLPKTDSPGELTVSNGVITATLRQSPHFMIELSDAGKSVPFAVLNKQAALRVESKFDISKVADADKLESKRSIFELKDLSAESFAGKTDSKPKGPQSIGFDVFFANTEHVYGLPEHASPLSLPDTHREYSEPFRLYNLDVFEYELNNSMALYGAIPYMLGLEKKTGRATSALWLNSAEMWVDVDKSQALEPKDGGVNSHWMVESGVLNLFIFRGQNPKDVSRQLTSLVGTQQLPPMFALGNHQCRWNYVDERDCLSVNSEFDNYDLPYDVLWLDIEHTDGKRYFTWASTHFPNPEQLQRSLAHVKRKLVTIVDPHIKSDANYMVSKKFSDANAWIADSSGKTFDGWCWPGSSNWPDYFREDVRQLWASSFKFDNYQGSTPDNYIWNDMNEPSVFTGPEITMPKDCLHDHGKVEHRDLHNMYGLLVQNATFQGLLTRQSEYASSELAKSRPFILSRAFYVGSQRFGAIWTGDNTASWPQLRATIPMLLSIGLAGISFAGADVGGFFNNPDEELITRWYQAAVFQPFLRNHAHIDTKRREPYLLPPPYLDAVRSALKLRYKLLPMWYTWFYHANVHGDPVMQPLSFQYPTVEGVAATDSSFFLGNGTLLVAPVLSQGQQFLDVYLPGNGNTVYYEYDSGTLLQSSLKISVRTPLHKIPVFVLGGSIITLRERSRRSSALMIQDPFTLHVYPDAQGNANGELFLDDGHSFLYKRGEFILVSWKFELNLKKKVATLSSTRRNASEKVPSSRLERIVIYGLPKSIKSAQLPMQSTLYNLATSPYISDAKATSETKILVVKNPSYSLNSSEGLKLEIHFA